MSIVLKKNVEGFKAVTDVLQSSAGNKSHLYIRISKVPGQVGVATLKKEASSFSAIKTYVSTLLKDQSTPLEEKKILMHSFEKLTDSFAKAKLPLLYRILFFPILLKRMQVENARKILKEFDAIQLPRMFSHQDPKMEALKKVNAETVENLKQKKVFIESEITAVKHLIAASMGSYVITEGNTPGSFRFIQKLSETFNFLTKAAEGIEISGNQNLQEEIDALVSPSGSLKLLKQFGRIFEDYSTAAKDVEASGSYALFYENQKLYFIQKFPNTAPSPTQAILIPESQNPIHVIQEQTSWETQYRLLGAQGKCVTDASKEDALKNLQLSDFLVYKGSPYSILYLIDPETSESYSERLESPHLFYAIHQALSFVES